MKRVPLIEDDYNCRAQFLSARNLPLDYMNDFSIMGFIVNPLNGALAAVKNAGYTLEQEGEYISVTIHTADAISHLGEVFDRHQVQWLYSDIADTIYQA